MTSINLQLTRPKKIALVVFSLLILIALAGIGGEIIVRSKGVQPWQLSDVNIIVSPGGKLYNKHPVLGYVHIPGDFSVTLQDGYSFKMTHLPNTLRITRLLATYNEPRPHKEIWIFGCSLTYGWSLNNQETYPWLLQERFPQYEIVNFGVGGYGTIHSLIQLREALQKGRRPALIILAYAGFHEERNVFLRNEQKVVAPFNKLGPGVHPYARLEANGKLSYHVTDLKYREFPLMSYSALSHFLEQIYNKFEENYYHMRQVSEALVLEIAGIAQKNEIPFVIAGITASPGTSKMLSLLQQHGFKAVDISVDLNIKENTNLPHDMHPNAATNRQYADKLETFLLAEVLK
jgi:hypothetical protein